MTKREAAEHILKYDGACHDLECDTYPWREGACNTEAVKQWLKDNPVSDWQELKIDDLSDCPDIFKGDYEFMWDSMNENESMKYTTTSQRLELFSIKKCAVLMYRKRQPEKKQPSHEEIMTKWWKVGNKWKKVIMYDTEGQGWYYLKDERGCVSKLWFENIKSADIPPEAIK